MSVFFICLLILPWIVLVYIFQQKEFGLVLAIQQAYILENMFCSSVLGCAADITFKFAWLREGFELEEGGINSTYLTT